MTKPPLPQSITSLDRESTLQETRRLAESTRALVATTSPSAAIDLLWQQLADWYPGCQRAVARYPEDSGDWEVIHTTDPGISRILRQTVGDPDPLTSGATGGCEIVGPEGRILAGRLAAGGIGGGVVVLQSQSRRFTRHDADVLDILLASAAPTLALLERPGQGRSSVWDEIIDEVTVALCMVGTDRRVIEGNRAFAALVGRSQSELTGVVWTEVVPADWVRIIRPMLQQGYTGDQRLIAHGDMTLSVRILRSEDSTVASKVLRLEDFTEQHRLQEQLIQSEKMSAIGQLIAGVAHDLNNPLASVVGFADFLLENASVTDQHREPLRVIQQEAERAASIVKNLLTFARKQAGRWRTTVVPELLKSTSDLMKNELASRDVELIIDIEPRLPELDVEPTRIQQVIVNLVTNAAQAITDTGRPGRVLLRASRWTDGIAIDVSDNGPGIPLAERAKVFEPFFTTKPEGTGTGLGLSISQGIVKEHGGQIVLAASGPNGTIFRIELPGTSEDTTSPVTPDSEVVTALSILVVDDEPHILHYMQATLEGWGHSVTLAPDGGEGLARIGEQEFDVIITDLRMPSVDGREFFQTLQETHPELIESIVFSTGDTVRDDTLAFLEQHGRPCLQKPFSLIELRRVLSQMTR